MNFECNLAWMQILRTCGIGLEAHRRYALYIKLIDSGILPSVAINEALFVELEKLPEVVFEKDAHNEF